MQVPKDELKERILTVATDVFLERGFERASMRGIAQKVGTSVSNIYNYFKNKEDLLHAILGPFCSYLNQLLNQFIRDESKGAPRTVEIEHLAKSIGEVLKKHRNEFLLLMDKSQGTRYENFKSNMIQLVETHIIKDHLNHRENSGRPKGTFMVHIIATNLVEALVEISRHYCDDDSTDRNISALMKYHIGGIEHLSS